jgi:sulfur carrier protein ThiS adenylyltransferase
VDATSNLVHQLNPGVAVDPVRDRFRRSSGGYGNVAFVCVDAIETRRLIWETLHRKAEFLCDGRMSAEVLRVLTVCDAAGKAHYPSTLFAASDAFRGSCTAKSTIYCANVAAGMMVSQFTRWLRGMPTEADLTLNLLSAELSVG